MRAQKRYIFCELTKLFYDLLKKFQEPSGELVFRILHIQVENTAHSIEQSPHTSLETFKVNIQIV